ncbi:sigma-54 interaction domain-containing protein [Polyangium aurulentum]|uniref:sigma-54 interaction domain-containing protein n=1 Tax=Polyangium aurulentum TaxID=2567896 RepID=UPI0010ADD65D|nr:sigma-54 dependent transcriptional regulator [Polyangium aurulentum]UQA63261.1 sigma-54 dependent transcriptional regulator [Polyangium aurulentum]
MPRLLAAWIGDADLRAAAREDVTHLGPIASALDALPFDELLLLCDRDPSRVHKLKDTPEVRIDTFLAWVRRRFRGAVHLQHEPLSSPTNYGEIYQAARRAIEDARARVPGVELTFHLSPGTSQMSAIWLILARTVFEATLIQSSIEAGVLVVDFPFELSAEFIPRLLRPHDRNLARLAAALPPEAPEFEEIIHQSEIMKGLVARARIVALRSVPVLLEGESGTGKELFARAIHEAGPRKGKPFVPVNCGALPSELIESELFGHTKGAFTGASSARTGYFQEADGGTLFLDEIGELPLPLQAKLLRVLGDKQMVTPVGARKPVEVNVRIIAATNRTLLDEVQAGTFREDLFYRLAVAVLQLPPLRKRRGDLGVLVDGLLAKVNQENSGELGFEPKRLSTRAKKRLLRHEWPGNVRELLNTLRRAAVWSAGTTIEEEDVEEALLGSAARGSAGHRDEMVLHRPLGDGLDLQELLDTVKKHYLERAMKEAGGNKSKAARLLGLSDYMMVTSWLKQCGMA